MENNRPKEGFLVLSRRPGESIEIPGLDISIVVSKIDYDRGDVKIAIKAPKHVKIFRKELLDKSSDRKDTGNQ